jgi:hypothetical protein
MNKVFRAILRPLARAVGVGYREDVLLYWKFPTQVIRLWRYQKLSHSQLNQDLFVLAILGFEKNSSIEPKQRVFVEVGAADGVYLSSTFLLEKSFFWRGLCVEPGKVWQADLQKNRNCQIDFRCVWSESNLEISFNETENATLSTISKFSELNSPTSPRRRGIQYKVLTVSLSDLFAQHELPSTID